MPPAAIESNESTSQSESNSNDLLLTIFWTHPMFSGVYGKIDHIFNGTDQLLLQKGHGIVAHQGRIRHQSPIVLVNPYCHGATFSETKKGRLLNVHELAFSRLLPIQE
jgi:hypothetical protein